MKKFKRINTQFFKKLWYNHTKVTISTILTVSRIVLTPCIVMAMIWYRWNWAFWLFVIAALTDILDGTIARWLKQKTFLGACLDPIADKILVVSCFAALAFIPCPLYAVPYWFFSVTLCKELLLIIGSCLLFYINGHLEVRPTLLGKMATCTQILFITLIFLSYFIGPLPAAIYYVMITAVLGLECAALIHYTAIGIRQLLV